MSRTGGGAGDRGGVPQEFVGETPWAHLHIAGTAWDTNKAYAPKGGNATASACWSSSPPSTD